ncbi:DUF2019 domain-containing protein [Bosea sp. F3-2]|uniref:DUF2019 domain-containing protein n=1 Tax=Bosea sp. F3-2 TaxID=2599640 RepID=UPI0011EDEE5C|nr:DUF2019 domain-containing protein [Bosea sp. F3-2]QEL23301.1 DUF2019 domain-containing protein [Bosea sp. F3-2]
MKQKQDIKALSNTEILKLFERLCVEQYDAIERNENARANRLILKSWALETELKSRPGDQRRVLMKLFGHPNMQVRLAAARANLAVDYVAARRELQAIVDEQWFPQAGDAGMTLEHLDSGFYRPT